MSKPLKPRRGTTAQHASFIGEAHEVTYDTDKQTLVCHDGLTAGGFPLARADEVGGMPLGTLIPYTGKDVPAGTLRADGTTYTGMQASFPDFYEWVVNSGITVPLADYALVEGSCGYYGLDTSTGTVRMPTLAAGVFGTVEAGKYGQAVQAGLPGVTGNIEYLASGTTSRIPNVSGVFSYGETSLSVAAGSNSYRLGDVSIDASRSSPIYGRSDTVTPSHVKYPWVIVVYNFAVPPSVAQAGEFIEMLDGKVDKTNPKDSKGTPILTSADGLLMKSANIVTKTVTNGVTTTAPSGGTWAYFAWAATSSGEASSTRVGTAAGGASVSAGDSSKSVSRFIFFKIA